MDLLRTWFKFFSSKAHFQFVSFLFWHMLSILLAYLKFVKLGPLLLIRTSFHKLLTVVLFTPVHLTKKFLFRVLEGSRHRETLLGSLNC